MEGERKCNLINSKKYYIILFNPINTVDTFKFNGIISVLAGEQCGKANRSVAKHIPGQNLDQFGGSFYCSLCDKESTSVGNGKRREA